MELYATKTAPNFKMKVYRTDDGTTFVENTGVSPRKWHSPLPPENWIRINNLHTQTFPWMDVDGNVIPPVRD